MYILRCFFPPCLSALWANEVTLHNGVWPYQWDGQHCCLSKIMWHVNELRWHMGQSLLLKAVYISMFRATFIYSWHIPRTFHSWCNDVNNDLLMLTVPSDLGSQTVTWHNLPAACVHDIYIYMTSPLDVISFQELLERESLCCWAHVVKAGNSSLPLY